MDFLTITGNQVLIYLFCINLILSVMIVFFQRRDPQSVWTWILALYFLPGLGIIIYLVLGQDYRKSKMFKIKGLEDRIKKVSSRQEYLLKTYESNMEDAYTREYGRLMYYNMESGGAIMTLRNQVRIFTDGQEKFASLKEDIRNAKKYIHFQYYIIKNDFLFDEIAELLMEKAREGVEVRILCDGMGGRFMPAKKWNRLKSCGIRIGIFFPAALGRINLRVNYRNHRKIVVIDGKAGYVGGFNVGKEYVDGDPRFGHWRDNHLRITGEGVFGLLLRFALDWHYATQENILQDVKYAMFQKMDSPEYFQDIPNEMLRMQIITSGPDSLTKQIRDNYIEIFNHARDHIYIQTPYFIPDDAVISALSFAARSGVQVILMIPNKPDHPFVYSATLSWAGTLLEAGGKVYTYENGFLHAKTIMADGKISTVGTANMDIRSFQLNFEVNAVMYDENITRILEEHFWKDIECSREITLEMYKNRCLRQRIREQFSRLLSPLL